MFKKLGVIALALIVSSSMAFAESGYKRKPHPKAHVQHNYHGGKPSRYHGGKNNRYHINKNNRYHGGNNNRYYGGKNNRYYGGHNNYYNKENNYYYGGGGNKYFYNDPYFWGGVASGIVGGAIINEYYDAPECRYVYQDIWVPGVGYNQRQVEVCD